LALVAQGYGSYGLKPVFCLVDFAVVDRAAEEIGKYGNIVTAYSYRLCRLVYTEIERSNGNLLKINDGNQR